MSIDYAWEKFFVAVDALATGKGSIKDRLFDAYISALIRLKSDDLPKELGDRFRDLQEELTQVESVADEGKVMASIRVMSEDRAVELAKEVVSLYDKIARNKQLKY